MQRVCRKTMLNRWFRWFHLYEKGQIKHKYQNVRLEPPARLEVVPPLARGYPRREGKI